MIPNRTAVQIHPPPLWQYKEQKTVGLSMGLMPCLIGRMENWNDRKGEEDRMDKTKAAVLLLFLFVKFILLVKKETFPVFVVNFFRSEICVMYMYDGLDRKFCSFIFFFAKLENFTVAEIKCHLWMLYSCRSQKPSILLPHQILQLLKSNTT